MHQCHYSRESTFATSFIHIFKMGRFRYFARICYFSRYGSPIRNPGLIISSSDFHSPLLPPCDIPHTFHHLRHFDLSSKAPFYVVEVGMSYGPIASRSSPLPQNIHRFAQFFEFWIFHMYRILAEDFFSPKSLEGGINYSFTMLVT